MILETEKEKEAWEFVKKLCDKATDRICNDLENEDYEKFKDLNVKSYDIFDKEVIDVKVQMDWQVVEWLNNQVKENAG